MVMITHDLSTAVQFADRIGVMYLGRIVESGLAQQVVRAPLHPYTRALLAALPRRDPCQDTTRAPLKGEAPDPTAIPAGISVPDPLSGGGESMCRDRSRAAGPRRCW